MNWLTFIFVTTAIGCTPLFGQPAKGLAPGGPGSDAHWPSAAKDAVGTATSLQSKVWFTLSHGVMTEVFYPTLDTPNTESLRFIVCHDGTCLDENDMAHSLRILDGRSLSFEQTNSAPGFRITKTYVTDVERPAVMIQIQTQSVTPAKTSLYIYYDPSLRNSGMHDTAWVVDDALVATDGNISSALISSVGFAQSGTTFAGVFDQPDQFISRHFARAENGNVVQLAKVPYVKNLSLVLGFGATPGEALENARDSLRKGFQICQREYNNGWHAYLATLRTWRKFTGKYRAQLTMSAMVLKALEDKTYRGATIASPSTPWGGGPNANEPTVSGYHAVWSRDLYHVATALVALGDVAAANRALDYLFRVQQRSDGSFPQNSWLDGRAIGGGLQLDEVALPIVLALQLNRTDQATWLKHIKPAADFITVNGPSTGQDRWEEKSGYSPATIAAEIAGLVCAARVASINHDQATAVQYLKTVDSWESMLDKWTATTNGPLSASPYYLRITTNGNPNQADKLEINSGGGTYDQRSIIDAGFLELVRLGIRRPSDPLILNSLDLVDKTLRVTTPKGPGWYRYNHDAYGERSDGNSYDGKFGRGRLWTFLTGERGEYELASGNINEARNALRTMAGFANEGHMFPEQVWDLTDGVRVGPIGTGTGSATPLAWSMAQFVRLAANLDRGRNFETPEIVTERYDRSRRRTHD